MWSDRESELDLLNVQHLVAAVEATVRADHLLPVTVGVFGDWGSGKSTVMNLARETLDKDEEILCVHFNGWLFEGYEDAKAAILGTILDRVSEKEGLGEEAKKVIGELVKRVNWFRLAGLVGSAAMMAQGLPPEAAMLAAGLQAAPSRLREVLKEAPDGEDEARSARCSPSDVRSGISRRTSKGYSRSSPSSTLGRIFRPAVPRCAGRWPHPLGPKSSSPSRRRRSSLGRHLGRLSRRTCLSQVR